MAIFDANQRMFMSFTVPAWLRRLGTVKSAGNVSSVLTLPH